MKSTLSYSLVFLLGLSLGYMLNLFQYKNSSSKLIEHLATESTTCSTPIKAEKLVESLPAQSENVSHETIKIETHGRVTNPTSPTAEAAEMKLEASQIQSPQDLQNFLKESLTQSPMETLKSRSDLDAKRAELLKGLFSGSISFDPSSKRKDKKWEVEMAIEGEFIDGRFKGHDEVKLFDSAGKAFSTTKSGAGSTLKHYKSGPHDSIIVETYGGKGFMQIYHIPKMEQFAGYYFEQKDVDRVELLGYVYLFKR